MSNRLPNIVIAGNAPQDKHAMLNAMLNEEELDDLCDILLYGAGGEPDVDDLEDAMEDWKEGKVDGIVCLPFADSTIEVLKQCEADDVQEAFPLYVNNTMRMASVMGDMDGVEAEMRMSKETLMKRVRAVAKTLKRDFLILNPRIAVAGGKDVAVDEEKQQDIVTVAIAEQEKEGIQAFGPVDAGTFFTQGGHQAFDALVTVYDEQCMKSFEEASDGRAMMTLMAGAGAPIVAAEYENVLGAVFLAIDVARNRKEYDAPFANVLPKLYKERREDGDKARFAVKKKGFNPAEHRRENVNYTTMPKPKPTQQDAAK